MGTHVVWMLGGGYYLYGDDHLLKCKDPADDVRYRPGLSSLLAEYLGDFEGHSRLALHNLTSYKMFWATLDASAPVLRAVESALISAAWEDHIPIQNDRRSAIPERARRVRVESVLPAGLNIVGLRHICEYGSQE